MRKVTARIEPGEDRVTVNHGLIGPRVVQVRTEEGGDVSALCSWLSLETTTTIILPGPAGVPMEVQVLW